MPGKAQSGGVDLIGLLYLACIFAVLFLPALLGRRSRLPPGPSEPDSDGGWGDGPRRPPEKPNGPRGGTPLPDAEQAPVRLRGHGRLADRHCARERRPTREPDRGPVRAVTGTRAG
jgi:hypothetical protein